MIKLLIGGSPCTYWSIAQKNNRETTAEGLGWELFKNYLIAKEKFKPDFFLYENNKSAAQAIKDQIKHELGVWDGTLLMRDTGARYIEINSALVSAQNRQRFYVHNCGEVGQPEDRGILLKDILESGVVDKDKSYCLKHQAGNTRDYFKKHHTQIAYEPVIIQNAHGFNKGGVKQGKTPTLTANGKWVYNNPVLTPVELLSVDYKACPHCKIKTTPNGFRCESPYGVTAQGYSVSYPFVKLRTLTSGNAFREKVITQYDGRSIVKKVYEVKDGLITIKGKQYPINLPDGYYIIRKLTVTECCRLQGMPDWWFLDKDGNKLVSDSQAYKGLGNGWQLDTVKYILEHALNKIPKETPILLLSMYDGIGTGRRILEELGFKNVKYYAYEIDKYCIALTKYRYPDVIHKGDAFKVRNVGEVESII